MVEGTENKLTQIEHIMKAISLSEGFHMSLSGTMRHRLSAPCCKYSFLFKNIYIFTLIEYSQQISGFTLIRNTPINTPTPQTGNNLADLAKKNNHKQTTQKKQQQNPTKKTSTKPRIDVEWSPTLFAQQGGQVHSEAI